MNENKKIMVWTAAALIIVAMIVLSVRAYANTAAPWDVKESSGSVITAGGSAGGAITQAPSGDVQAVKLTLDSSYNYQLIPSTLKKGVPVRMEVDTSKVVGCAAGIVIPDFGVTKYVNKNDNIITFTPDKAGNFVIHCTMNMYHGTFQVTDDGAPSTTLAPAKTTPSSAGSCGAGGGAGGCGCGMMRRPA